MTIVNGVIRYNELGNSHQAVHTAGAFPQNESARGAALGRSSADRPLAKTTGNTKNKNSKTGLVGGNKR